MADNPKLHCCGIVELVPPPQPPAKPSNKRPLITDSAEVERTTRSSHHDGSGGGFATQFDKKHKAEGFVDRTTGRAGFKEEVKYKSTVKVDDKWSGCTDVYSTQVKLKRVTYQPAVKAVPRFKNKRVNYH